MEPKAMLPDRPKPSSREAREYWLVTAASLLSMVALASSTMVASLWARALASAEVLTSVVVVTAASAVVLAKAAVVLLPALAAPVAAPVLAVGLMPMLESALALQPGNTELLSYRGHVLCESDRVAEGFAVFRQSAQLAYGQGIPVPAGAPPHKLRHDTEQQAWLGGRAQVTGPLFLDGGARLAGPAINPMIKVANIVAILIIPIVHF